MRWFDSHCHIHDPRIDQAEAVEAARVAGVHRMVTVGCNEATTRAAIESARVHTNVWATVGLHPHDATDGLAWASDLLDRSAESRVVGVGECGLDYFYEHSPRDTQKRMFAEQIQLAHRYDLPLVIHTRDAWDDTFAVLHAEGTPTTTIFHCFTGGADEAAACLALHNGVYLSYSGIITFKTAENLRAAAAVTPLDRTLVETDTPYLAPIPYRGKPNRPAFVPYVGAAVAEAQNVGVEELAAATWMNTHRAFRVAEPGTSTDRTGA
jgi:TatD DNase family protein